MLWEAGTFVMAENEIKLKDEGAGRQAQTHQRRIEKALLPLSQGKNGADKSKPWINLQRLNSRKQCTTLSDASPGRSPSNLL